MTLSLISKQKNISPVSVSKNCQKKMSTKQTLQELLYCYSLQVVMCKLNTQHSTLNTQQQQLF